MYKILIADDEFEMRHGLFTYFPWSDIGFDVCGTVENGQEALEYLKAHQDVDVLLCDIIMPVMTGIELITAMRRGKLNTRTIFFSQHSNFSYAQDAIEFGASGYVLKTTNFNELIRIFSKVKNQLDLENCIKTPLVENDSNHSEKIVATIQKYVQANYRTVTLEDLASIVHMNSDYISKYFKKHTNVNFSDYLMEVRMHKAAELLNDIHYKTYEVGDMVGYCNAFNFTRAFKKYFGMSPKEYKNQKSTKS